MIKNNKWKLIISSILIVLPTLFGIIVWDELPEQMAIHWGIGGDADGFAKPLAVVLLIPVILLVLYWAGLFITFKDTKQKAQSEKALNLIFWIMPVISLFSNGIIYATAFGMELNVSALMFVLIGISFMIIGNYMPKIKQNQTLGIKIRWTLLNEENWNATHRFSGKVYVAAGVLSLFGVFLPIAAVPFAFITIILLAVIPVVLYSYLYYKKQLREGKITNEDYKLPAHSKTYTVIISIIVGAIILLAISVCFTGNIKMLWHTDSFTVEASYNEDLVIKYSDIESVEFRENAELGERVIGFGTPRLSVGLFHNKEFGNYTRYTYTQCDACVVLTLKDNKTVVLSRPDTAQTQGIYEEILGRWNQFKEAN